MDELDIFLSSDEDEEVTSPSRFLSFKDNFKDMKSKRVSDIGQKRDKEKRIEKLNADLRKKIMEISRLNHDMSKIEHKHFIEIKSMSDIIKNIEQKHGREVNSLKARIHLLQRSSVGDDDSDNNSPIESETISSKYEEEIQELKRKIDILEITRSPMKNGENEENRIKQLEQEIKSMKMTLSSDRGIMEFINKEAEELSTAKRKEFNIRPSRKERLTTLLAREKRYKKLKKIIQKYSEDFLHSSEVINGLKAKIIEMTSSKETKASTNSLKEKENMRLIHKKFGREVKKNNLLQTTLKSVNEKNKILNREKDELIEKLSKQKKIYNDLILERKKKEHVEKTNYQKKLQLLIQKLKKSKQETEKQSEKRVSEISNLKQIFKREKTDFEKKKKKYESEISLLTAQNKKIRVMIQEQIDSSKKQKKVMESRRKKTEIFYREKIQAHKKNIENMKSKHKMEISTHEKENEESKKMFESIIKTKIESKDKEIQNLRIENGKKINELLKENEENYHKIKQYELMNQEQQNILKENRIIQTEEKYGTFFKVLEREHEEMSIQIEQYEIKFEEIENHIQDLNSDVEKSNKESELLKKELQELKAENLKLENRVRENNQELSISKVNNSELREKLKESSLKNKSFEKFIRSMKIQIDDVQNKKKNINPVPIIKINNNNIVVEKKEKEEEGENIQKDEKIVGDSQVNIRLVQLRKEEVDHKDEVFSEEDKSV